MTQLELALHSPIIANLTHPCWTGPKVPSFVGLSHNLALHPKYKLISSYNDNITYKKLIFSKGIGWVECYGGCASDAHLDTLVCHHPDDPQQRQITDTLFV